MMDATKLLKERVLITLDEFAQITGQTRSAVENRAQQGTLGVAITYMGPREAGVRRKRFIKTSEVRRLLDEPAD